MNAEIRPSLQIVLSYALLISVLFGLIQQVFVPLHKLTATRRESVISLIEQNDRFSSAIREYQATINNQGLIAPAPQDHASQEFIEAGTTALAGAQLQSQLKALISKQGATLEASSVSEAESETQFQKLVISLRFRTSLQALTDFLYEVEQQEIAFFVDSLVIQSRHGHGRVFDSVMDELDVRLDIAGFMKKNPEGASP